MGFSLMSKEIDRVKGAKSPCFCRSFQCQHSVLYSTLVYMCFQLNYLFNIGGWGSSIPHYLNTKTLFYEIICKFAEFINRFSGVTYYLLFSKNDRNRDILLFTFTYFHGFFGYY